MSSELRVPAIKAQAQRMVEDWEGPQHGSKPAMIAVLKDLLAAFAAAEAERDAARAERDDADHVRRLVQQRNAALRQHARLVAPAPALPGHGIRVYIRVTDLESGLDYTLACGHGSTRHHIAAAAVETSTGVEKVCQMALAHREQTGCVCAADEEGSRGN
jgi:hypothetical protein